MAVNDNPETACGKCEAAYMESADVWVCGLTGEAVNKYCRPDNCPKDKEVAL